MYHKHCNIPLKKHDLSILTLKLASTLISYHNIFIKATVFMIYRFTLRISADLLLFDNMMNCVILQKLSFTDNSYEQTFLQEH